MPEEAKDRSRRKLEELEGTSDPDSFTASTQSEKKHANYDADAAAEAADFQVRSSLPAARRCGLWESALADYHTLHRQ